MENEYTREIRRIIIQPASENFMMPREFLTQLFNEEKDNIRMIEKLSQKPVLAVVAEDDTLLHADAASLISLYQ